MVEMTLRDVYLALRGQHACASSLLEHYLQNAREENLSFQLEDIGEQSKHFRNHTAPMWEGSLLESSA